MAQTRKEVNEEKRQSALHFLAGISLHQADHAKSKAPVPIPSTQRHPHQHHHQTFQQNQPHQQQHAARHEEDATTQHDRAATPEDDAGVLQETPGLPGLQNGGNAAGEDRGGTGRNARYQVPWRSVYACEICSNCAHCKCSRCRMITRKQPCRVSQITLV